MQQTKAYLKFEVEINRDEEDCFSLIFVNDDADCDVVPAGMLDAMQDWVDDHSNWYPDRFLPVPTPEQERENQECEEFHRARDEGEI